MKFRIEHLVPVKNNEGVQHSLTESLVSTSRHDDEDDKSPIQS